MGSHSRCVCFILRSILCPHKHVLVTGRVFVDDVPWCWGGSGAEVACDGCSRGRMVTLVQQQPSMKPCFCAYTQLCCILCLCPLCGSVLVRHCDACGYAVRRA